MVMFVDEESSEVEPLVNGTLRSDEGNNLLDRAARSIHERNKMAAELIQHSKRHLAIAKDHEREAREAINTANLLLGEKAKPREPSPVVEFMFNTKRELISFGKLVLLVFAGGALIALGAWLG